jgi:RNA polymerase sigma-70 factor (family 1)
MILPSTAPQSFKQGTAIPQQFPGNYPVSCLDMDALLLRVLNQDDYSAFEVLFKKMYSPLCVFCLKFVSVNEVAEELVSDVFYTIWKNRNKIKVSAPKAYLFTAVRNKAYDHLRAVKRSVWCDIREASDVPVEDSNSEDLLIHEELSKHLEQTIALLPKQCRLIFELSREHGMKYKDIATMLNISIKTVETQMGRALKHLRRRVPSALAVASNNLPV